MQISNPLPPVRGMFKVNGQNHEGLWKMLHPSGLDCSGLWHTEEDAQHDADRWNARRLKALEG